MSFCPCPSPSSGLAVTSHPSPAAHSPAQDGLFVVFAPVQLIQECEGRHRHPALLCSGWSHPTRKGAARSCQEAPQDAAAESKFLPQAALKVSFCSSCSTQYLPFPHPVLGLWSPRCPCPALLPASTSQLLLLCKYQHLTFSLCKACVKPAL